MDSLKPAYLLLWQELLAQSTPNLTCKQQGHSNCAPSCNDILQHKDEATPSERVCRSYPGKDRLTGSYKLLLLLLLAFILLLKLQALCLSCSCSGISLRELFLHSCMLTLYLLDITGTTWTDLASEQLLHTAAFMLIGISCSANSTMMQQPSLTSSTECSTTFNHRQYEQSWKATAEGT